MSAPDTKVNEALRRNEPEYFARLESARANLASRGGPCIEPGCHFSGLRKLCYDCAPLGTEPGPRSQARCPEHDVAHRHAVHGIEPTPVACAGCRKPLGTFASLGSPSGGPWCGDCTPWWHW